MKTKKTKKKLTHEKRNWTGFFRKHGILLVFLLLLIADIFLRSYKLENLSPFGWDQVDNAWVAKSILVDHKFTLFGPAARWNTGLFIGPLYYYLVALFYFLTNLDPIASPLLAVFASIISVAALYYVLYKIFDWRVAMVAMFLSVFSFSNILFERTQWEVNFIPAISLFTLYCLYRIIHGNERFIFYLVLGLGISFHVHLTALVFLPIISLFVAPFFPWSKNLFKYLLLSIPFFLLLISPVLISLVRNRGMYAIHSANFLSGSSHGFHLTRFSQLLFPSFVEFESFLQLDVIKHLGPILIAIFIFIFIKKSFSRERAIFCYMLCLWFLIPWIIFTFYSGEITDYYFSVNRPMVLMIISYFLVELLSFKRALITILLFIFFTIYAIFNLKLLFNKRTVSLDNDIQKVRFAINNKKKIPFVEGSPESYIYYVYTRNKK